MSLKSLSLVAAAALALCAGVAQAATQNGFANGGFENDCSHRSASAWLAGGSFAASWLSSPTAIRSCSRRDAPEAMQHC